MALSPRVVPCAAAEDRASRLGEWRIARNGKPHLGAKDREHGIKRLARRQWRPLEPVQTGGGAARYLEFSCGSGKMN
jgi:hypothetical protein